MAKSLGGNAVMETSTAISVKVNDNTILPAGKQIETDTEGGTYCLVVDLNPWVARPQTAACRLKLSSVDLELNRAITSITSASVRPRAQLDHYGLCAVTRLL
jgi:hypothetical protein